MTVESHEDRVALGNQGNRSFFVCAGHSMHASTCRDLRLEMGMSREQLAAALGEPVAHIRAWEESRTRIRGPEASAISRLLRQNIARRRRELSQENLESAQVKQK